METSASERTFKDGQYPADWGTKPPNRLAPDHPDYQPPPVDLTGMHMMAVPTTVMIQLLQAVGNEMVIEASDIPRHPQGSEIVTDWVIRDGHATLQVVLLENMNLPF